MNRRATNKDEQVVSTGKTRVACYSFSVLMLALLLMFSACSSQDFPVASGQGTVSFTVCVDATITMDDGSKVTVSPDLVPEPGSMRLTMTSASGRYSHTWESLDDFLSHKETYLAGQYTAELTSDESSYGPSFGAGVDFSIVAGNNTDVEMTVRPTRAMVDMSLTRANDLSYSLDSVLVHVAGGDYLRCDNGVVFIDPGKAEFIVCLSNASGKTANLLLPVSATAKAACGIMVGVSAENGRVVVSCGAQTADVAVSDRLFIEGMPTITPVGFIPGVPFKAAEGIPPSAEVLMKVVSPAPIENLTLSVQSNITDEYSFDDMTEVDAMHPTDRQKQLLERAGFIMTVNADRTEAVVNFTKVIEALSSLKTSTTHFVVTARTADGRCSMPMTLVVDTETIEFKSVSITPAVIGIDKVTLTLHSSIGDVERDDFRLLVDNNGTTCPILAWNVRDDGVVDVEFSVPRGTADLPVTVEYMGLNRLTVTVRRTNPEYSAAVDAFAKTAIVRFSAEGYGEAERQGIIEALTALGTFTVDGKPASVSRRDEADGLVYVNGLIPATRYNIGVKIGANDPVTTLSCVTESTQQLASADFSDWRDLIEYNHLPCGGQYSATDVPIFNRQNFTDIDVDWPKKSWASLNAKTFYRGSANHNTWYMQPSAWIENTELKTKAICIASTGWDHNGEAIRGYVQQPGDFVPYSRNIPNVSHRSAGRLWLGRYDYDGNAETVTEGEAFTSRPSSLNGFFKYQPDLNTPDDRGFVSIELVNIDSENTETIVAEGYNEFETSPDYKAFSVPLQYKKLNMRPTHIRVMFVSTTKAGRNISAGEDRLVPVTADLPDARFIGSQLYVTALILSY